MALTNPVSGEEEAFHRWYEEIHIPELLRYAPEFRSARRYRLTAQAGAPASWSHVALYEADSDDPKWMETRMPQTRSKLTSLQSVAPDHEGWLWSAAGKDAA